MRWGGGGRGREGDEEKVGREEMKGRGRKGGRRVILGREEVR